MRERNGMCKVLAVALLSLLWCKVGVAQYVTEIRAKVVGCTSPFG